MRQKRQTSQKVSHLMVTSVIAAARKVRLIFRMHFDHNADKVLGHWIQACPTNDDPNFEGRTRIKRTTGIPRSMLRTVEQSEINQLDEAQRQNLMLDSDGRHVLAKTDDATWAKHLEK